MVRRHLEIVNRLGLHARAAAKLVNCATGFASVIEVERHGQRVNCKSIMGIMMLGAGRGAWITVDAAGEDEGAAIAAIAALFSDRFGEPE
ncbi:MAG TPA: HPr family phosphocarrier protein [Lamprocystis sp. (in: g-proteobacteria)]|nr:HPr family phosphocarrier protein [Lamprocystis sp. (in: g-proteobacteria)]